MNRIGVQKAKFIWFFALTTVFVLFVGAFWYMSPLGFGFAEWPADPSINKFAQSIYVISYYGGLPLLLFGQVASAIAAISGRYKLAFAIPVFSIGTFTLLAVTVLLMIE